MGRVKRDTKRHPTVPPSYRSLSFKGCIVYLINVRSDLGHETVHPPTSAWHCPPPPPDRAAERGAGKGCKLTLISASAGFGKTTLVSEWIAGCGQPVAWLSLDEGDNDPTRFLAYLVAALQTIAANIGAGVLAALQSPQPPSTESLLTALLNEIIASRTPRSTSSSRQISSSSGRLPRDRFPTG